LEVTTVEDVDTHWDTLFSLRGLLEFGHGFPLGRGKLKARAWQEIWPTMAWLPVSVHTLMEATIRKNCRVLSCFYLYTFSTIN
jgi:hypothetical protein